MNVEALEGIKILDLTRLLPGPFCTMMMADLGAEVIKIEEPGKGDYMRAFPPKINEESAFFLSLNRNKKSITLNLKKEKGKDLLYKLAEKADVVIEGFRPGVAQKLKIDYNMLKKINSEIIMCSISGYGQNGPYKKRAGHDLNYLSICGIAGVTGTRDKRPTIPGVQIADIAGGGLFAAFSILAAIIAKNKTGKGQYIDVSMMDGAFSLLSPLISKYFADGTKPFPAGELLNGGQPCYNIYKTKDDKYMSLCALEPHFWQSFCKTVNREDLITSQFAEDNKSDDIISTIESLFSEKTRDEWVKIFKDADCCCEAVNSIDEAIIDPQIAARNLFTDLQHSTEGDIKLLNFPIKLSETPANIKTAAPKLGEHNIEIYTRLGLNKTEIDILAKNHII